MGRTATMPCRITPGEFLRLEARLLGRARPRPDGSDAVPAADRDREIRRRAACGEEAAAIGRTLKINAKTVLRSLGRLRRGGTTR
jgi:hypothetical protein